MPSARITDMPSFIANPIISAWTVAKDLSKSRALRNYPDCGYKSILPPVLSRGQALRTGSPGVNIVNTIWPQGVCCDAP